MSVRERERGTERDRERKKEIERRKDTEGESLSEVVFGWFLAFYKSWFGFKRKGNQNLVLVGNLLTKLSFTGIC